MMSICESNINNSNSYQHFQLTNGNIMLLQQHQPQQHQQQQHQHQLQQLIAPKLPLGNSQMQNIQQSGSSNVGPIAKKAKYSFTSNTVHMPYGEQLPSVARRNARERNRVKQVNNGFVNLRQHLPQSVINNLSNGGRGASKKLSKVDTLRIAVEYIRGLQDLLDDGQASGSLYTASSSGDESSNDAASYQDYNSSLGSPPQATQFVHQQHSYHSSSSPTSSSYSECEHPASYIKQEIKSFDSFDSFSDEQPDDEELLDYISSWQEQ